MQKMASSKTNFLLLGLVFTAFVLIFSEVSARELADETADQLEKSGGNEQGERDSGVTGYVEGGNVAGKAHGSSCDIHRRSCQVGGHDSNNRGGKGGSHERDPGKRYGGGGSHVGGEHGSPCHDIHKRNCGQAGVEHGPHNHRGEEGGSHARGEHGPYNGGGKGGSHERGEHGSYKGGGGGGGRVKGNTGRSVKPGGPGSDVERETEN